MRVACTSVNDYFWIPDTTVVQILVVIQSERELVFLLANIFTLLFHLIFD